MVESNPKAGPASLKAGTRTRQPVSELDPALANQGRVKYLRERVLKSKNDDLPGSLKGGIGSLMRWHDHLMDQVKNLEAENFLVDVELLDEKNRILTVQSPYMREVLRECKGGLNSDTIEGVIFDSEYPKNACVHFTSAHDYLLNRWVPVLRHVVNTNVHFTNLLPSSARESVHFLLSSRQEWLPMSWPLPIT